MKSIIPSSFAPILLSVLRIVAGLLFLNYGTAKILGWPHVEYFAGLQAFSLVWFAGLIELIGGILLILGLFTRYVAFIVAGEMAFAYFMGHAPNSFFPVVNNGVGAILFCFICLYLAAAGPGPWSLDAKRGDV